MPEEKKKLELPLYERMHQTFVWMDETEQFGSPPSQVAMKYLRTLSYTELVELYYGALMMESTEPYRIGLSKDVQIAIQLLASDVIWQERTAGEEPEREFVFSLEAFRLSVAAELGQRLGVVEDYDVGSLGNPEIMVKMRGGWRKLGIGIGVGVEDAEIREE